VNPALLLVAYLLGSVSGSLLLGRWRGVDIRRVGSGNAGATNALRTQGWAFALGTAAIDVGKGMLAAGLLPRVLPVPDPWVAGMSCAFAATLGHCFPLWHGFRGGKGAATLIGAIAVLLPSVALLLVLLWVLGVGLTGFVGPITALMALLLPVLAWWRMGDELPPAVWPWLGALALLVLAMHQANLRRFFRGLEPRTERLWWLKPRARGGS
jgi:glycerol-3-phosphate acyltransferase PlsY